MINNGINSSFPSQAVSSEEKMSIEFGNKVGNAIEAEWFRGGNGHGTGGRFYSNWQDYHRLRLYADGNQPVGRYKDELSVNGDLSYLNLDWKPIAVLSKFVDIVVNGMTDKGYEIKAVAIDPFSQKQRSDYAGRLVRDMNAKSLLQNIEQELGLDLYASPNKETIPESEEELQSIMQRYYKQGVEIAEEEVINNILDFNRYSEIKKRVSRDLTVLGIGATKTSFNNSEGVTVEYVDPANLIYSYTDDPNFEDLWYVGEVKTLPIAELKKQFPHANVEEIMKNPGVANNVHNPRTSNAHNDEATVLYFEYKTYIDQVFKVKKTDQGLEKAIEKEDTFNPPENDNFSRVSRTIEVLFSGAKILGTDELLHWGLCENITRPDSDQQRVGMNYCISAPRLYRGRIDSLVRRCIGFVDMIQITHLKIQQLISKMVPPGVFVDVDGLAEVDLGNGTTYNPAEALNMYFQTGSIVGRSLTQDGDMNRGKVPIQELQSSSGLNQMNALIQTYQYYLQMIRDVTGLNEARDGSMPAKDSLVGLQKLAAANSNTATRHILQSLLYITVRTCENISLRVADMLEYPLTKNALMNSINAVNTATLEEIQKLNLHEFGIFLELEPEEEDKQRLESNIQVALQTGSIDLSDAIDIRSIQNIKLANQFLKIRQKKKREEEQQRQQANIQAQAQANAETAERAAQAEMQKQQALAQTELQIEQGKSQYKIQQLREEAAIKKELMAEEFQYNLKLAQMQSQIVTEKEKFKEDRKDERTKIQATQQSELIDQRKNDSLPKNFESSGNDVLGSFNLGSFEPK